MDKFILIKQSFYCNYDVIKFDSISIRKTIKDIKRMKDCDINNIIYSLDELYNEIFQTNIKEIVLSMEMMLMCECSYSVDKLLSGLEVIYYSLVKKEMLYQKYINFIDNLA